MMKRCKKKFKVSMIRRAAALSLAAVTAFSAAGCGKSDSEGSTEQKKEWAYVPEFLTIDAENVDYYDMQLMGDKLYYMAYNWNEETGESSQDICSYSLTDGQITSKPLALSGNKSLSRGKFGPDGSMYAIMYSYNEDYSESEQLLVKYDAEGNEVFSGDVTDLVGDSYVDTIAVDGDGRIYAAGDGVVWLFDGEGNRQGTVSVSGSGDIWIDTIGTGRDGNIYLGYNNYDGSSSTYSLCPVDFEGKKLGDALSGAIPRSSGFVAGVDYDFLMNDGTSVYGYNLDKGEMEYLFDWLDSDINGNNVRKFGQLEDGRIVVVIEDWENNDNGIALLTKKKADEVPQKETIVIATMGGHYSLQSRAVKFNKASDKYHISIKEYVDYSNYGENTWSDALTSLNNDLTSSNCPDMLDLSSLNVSQLVAKGILEDLNPYLEKSAKLNRDDFIENVLNVYTYDGSLVSIPTRFSMQTVIGSKEMVGDGNGWTMEALINLANQYPDAELFDRVPKQSILQVAMMFNEDAFIDWSTGECNFDSDGFKSILEFVNRFPDEVNWEQGQDSEPTRIQNGEVLLAQAYIYDFDQLQMYNEIFQGDYTCIGFPTVDGTGGHALSASEAYAITTKSGRKDGAWEFIESILTEEDNENGWYSGFPTMKSKLERMAEKAVTPDYILDENGEIMKDENGDPIVSGGGSSIGYQDGWEYTYRKATQEEVDQAMALMNEAKPVNYNGDDEISKIINEEAEPYFKGQKSVDEVASIIQNRIFIYVGENK